MASPLDAQYKPIRDLIDKYAAKYGVDRKIGYWQLWQESRFNPQAKSGVGAAGIAQFMPATAAQWGVDVDDLESSIEGWAKYMAWILRQPYVHGNYKLALAAYNAGVGNVKKYAGVPPFAETQDYVDIITRNRGIIGISAGGALAVAGLSYLAYKKLKKKQ